MINTKLKEKIALVAACFLSAVTPVQSAEDPSKEKPLVVRHTPNISLPTLKNQLQNFPDTVFIEAELRPHNANLPIGDVIDIDAKTAQDACDQGQLFLLPVNRLPAALNLSSVIDDYLPDTLGPCAVGHTLSSSVIAYNTVAGEPKPSILGDLFDLFTFPGPRALAKTPRGIAERALLAHGVSADQLYSTLDQPSSAWPIIESVLNSLQHQILWVKNDQMAIQAIESRQARFAVISGQSAVRHSASGGSRLDILWDQALHQIHMWAIPASSQNQAAAWTLIQHLAAPQVNGRYSTAAGNGPARHSAMLLVGATQKRQLPGNANNMVLQNDAWWHENLADYQARFDAWLARRQADNITSESRPTPLHARWLTPATQTLFLVTSRFR